MKKICLLIKESTSHQPSLKKYYIDPIGIDTVVYKLQYNESNKAPITLIKKTLDWYLPKIKEAGINMLLVADASYFKKLAKVTKADPYVGHIMECRYPGYEDMHCVYTLSYASLIHNPDNLEKIELSNKAITDYYSGGYTEIGSDIIHLATYPDTHESIRKTLLELLREPVLTCDIETYGLALQEADLASIAFAWNEHEGTAFRVTDSIKSLLREFFEHYKGKLVFHNASFDIRNIIYRCFMKDPLDNEGLLHGLEVMYRNTHDTKLIAYLATNSTVKKELGLKALSQEFAGNYAVDVTDVTKLTTEELLKYNLTDCLATWYVAKKYWPILMQEDQYSIYMDLFLPSLKVITHMELVGLPMDLNQVIQADESLTQTVNKYRAILENSPIIKSFEWKLTKQLFIKRNKKLKKKIVDIEDCRETFNPNSSVQLQDLLYSHMGFEIIDTTDKGSPATGKDTIKKQLDRLMNQYSITEEELGD